MKWLLTASSTEGAILRYVEWLALAGIQGVVVLPSKENLEPRAYDAVLLTGGGDVDASWYGELSRPETCLINRDRDAFELRLVERFIHLGRPVLGVCRGLQVINVALGGKLIQHLPAGVVERHKGKKDMIHPVNPVVETRLGAALSGAVDINST
ncbi:MAG: gamma-glutamyl-gamma-aminobutyrate hydrolase family protein, partial [Lentisphaerota bacterium]